MKDFFVDVIEVVKLIPHGRVTTYGAIARYLGSPKSSRAVGWALNKVIIDSDIPAHRDLIYDLGYGYLVNNKKDIISILSSNDNVYCQNKHSLFTKKWNMKSVVKKEIKFIKQICAEY